VNRRGSSPEQIGGLVESLLADSGYLAVCREHDIVRRWAELAGDRIAAATECQSVERGVVRVRVHSAPWRNELMYLKPMLLSRLKANCATITDIVFS
jgi:predicted nucleic acid-binding Zn ribbon protein